MNNSLWRQLEPLADRADEEVERFLASPEAADLRAVIKEAAAEFLVVPTMPWTTTHRRPLPLCLFFCNTSPSGGSLSGSAVAWFLIKTEYSATSRRPATPAPSPWAWSHPRPIRSSDHDAQLRDLNFRFGSPDVLLIELYVIWFPSVSRVGSDDRVERMKEDERLVVLL